MTTATLTREIRDDAETVARANHLEPVAHRHDALAGWLICVVDTEPGQLGFHEVVVRVSGRENRRTAQAAALQVVRSGRLAHVHQVRRCGCTVG